MPSAYTHYRFGREALALLPENLRLLAKQNRALYNIGLHGPDIFFYYDPLHGSRPVGRLGATLHAEPAAGFFEAARGVLGPDPDHGALAYVLGFLGHFALDSRCHPYIDQLERMGLTSHTHIEAELDAVYMDDDGLPAGRYVPVHHIRATAENAAVIARFFPSLTQRQVLRCLRNMVLVQHLLTAPGTLHREALYGALRLSGKYKDLSGLVIATRRDPHCRGLIPHLQELYGLALEDMAAMAPAYTAAVCGGGPLPARMDHNFG